MAAGAELPAGARAMIDAAVATGDDTKVATVIELARATWPTDSAEIDAIESQWKVELAQRKSAKAAHEAEAVRQAGFFALWSGEGEFGGFKSSGNTDTAGISASLKLERKGLDWAHLVKARVDYQRQGGTTSREQFLASYEPRWQFGKNVFAYGLAQYERNRLQGFDGRYAVSGGLGYKVIDRDGLSLAVKAGPAWRVTQFTDGSSESSLAGLAALDFDWQVLDRLKLTQDTNVVAETGGEAVLIVDGSNTTLNLVTGLDFEVSDRLRARMAYQIDYDSNPPAGKVSTDTLTRATLIYGF